MRARTRLLYAGWGVFVLSGAAWWLICLLLGFGGVRDCRRKSTSIADADLLAEIEQLRQALWIRRPVEAREHSSLVGSGAAAAGWLRPFVLLPRDWRSWSGVERRAVLAHEMAAHRSRRLHVGNCGAARASVAFLSSAFALAGLAAEIAPGACC